MSCTTQSTTSTTYLWDSGLTSSPMQVSGSSQEMYTLTKQEIKNLHIREMNDPVTTKMFQAYEI